MNLTPWFPGDVKPVREGVYERRLLGDATPFYSYWNGRYWAESSITPRGAMWFKGRLSGFQNMPWRGVKK